MGIYKAYIAKPLYAIINRFNLKGAQMFGVYKIVNEVPTECRLCKFHPLNCAQKNVEAVDNSVQQLKAEIAALANQLDTVYIPTSEIVDHVIFKLRQLSVV
jgi:hypothetical protein